ISIVRQPAAPARAAPLLALRAGFVGITPIVVNQEYAELAELAGGFVHDLKNHLSTLRLNLQLLAEDFQDPQTQRERRALDRISRLQNECQRLVDISNEFLRFARVKDLELAPANLNEVVEELTDFFGPMARASNIEIKSYIPADLPPLALNRDMFKQALLNLLLNAQQAMPSGGEITLLARTEPESVIFELIDTGCGMSPEVLAKAFRPFYSTRSGGTGLGLPTTRKIIEAHGGSLDVQSEVGHGTKFTIRLPVKPAG
ncbi:MAG: sensor histidine kinase, partial [Gemmataceae bacterium]